MGGVVDAVSNAVSDVVDTVGNVVSDVVDAGVKVVDAVGTAIENTAQAAVNDPIGTMAKVAAVATGNVELLPLISAADVVAHGGDLQQAAIAAGTTYVAQGVANYVAADLSTANTYDTTPFSEQTRMLAEQNAGMITPDQLSNAIGAGSGSAVRTAITTGDLQQSLVAGLTGGAGSYVGQEVKADTADLLGKTGSTIAGNVAGATTAGFLQGKDPNQVFGSSLVNNLINVNLANLNAGKGSEPEPTKKAETPNDILTAYNSLNDLDKTFVNTAVMTGTDLETAVNYAMANPTMTTSMKDGVQYAALDTGTRTDAGGGNYWTLNADGSVRTDPSGNSEVKNADGTWPSEAPPPVSESKPEFKYNSDGSIDELQKDGSYQRINDIKLDESGKIMTLDNEIGRAHV